MCIRDSSYAEFDPSASAAAEAPAPQPQEAAAPSQPISSAPVQAPAAAADGKRFISPRARALAERTGVNPAFLAGSGPYGRIVEQDVRAFIAAGGNATYAAEALSLIHI